ncbi:MAG: ABC transporter permease [Spirochaetae bacterium HGW-Spirochaetae-4]|nr:MAG: ABC transporter permease [Spirochaetae bacterium HGW-Spirochaetae-8]PKL22253.1 MAG: ABC transporter permease [Spirochaetae bacterium HGW-Spirochaetae-4]
MRRNDFALRGLRVVTVKELQDFTGSARMVILTALILITAASSLYTATNTMKTVVSEDEFLLLSLFTLSRNPVPSLLSFLSFLVPLTGIAMGFDVVNSEFQNRTLKRVLSQPIHRDVLLFGKAVGALGAMTVVLLALWMLVIGSAMLVLGLPPSTEQVARALAFYGVTLAFGMFWFLVAMFFSVVFRQQATSALVSLGLWLLLTVFWSMIAQVVATAVGGVGSFQAARLEVLLSRISPNTLFAESALALLSPSTRTLGVVMFTQLEGALMGSPLPFGQSLLLIWPQLSALVALLVLLFTASYVVFQRQEL